MVYGILLFHGYIAVPYLYCLGSSHYILQMTNPNRGFSAMSEGEKLLGQLVSEGRKIKKGKLTDFQ